MNINSSNNSTLIGYNNLFLDIKNIFDKKILPNKIIFSGNRGIGKCTFAYHLINYIFSINEDSKYNFNDNIILKENRSYNLITNNLHPNFFLISSDDDKKNIQISKIREMIEFTNMSSFNGYKALNVFILPSEDLVVVRTGLTKNADMNTLLKGIINSIKK